MPHVHDRKTGKVTTLDILPFYRQERNTKLIQKQKPLYKVYWSDYMDTPNNVKKYGKQINKTLTRFDEFKFDLFRHHQVGILNQYLAENFNCKLYDNRTELDFRTGQSTSVPDCTVGLHDDKSFGMDYTIRYGHLVCRKTNFVIKSKIRMTTYYKLVEHVDEVLNPKISLDSSFSDSELEDLPSESKAKPKPKSKKKKEKLTEPYKYWELLKDHVDLRNYPKRMLEFHKVMKKYEFTCEFLHLRNGEVLLKSLDGQVEIRSLLNPTRTYMMDKEDCIKIKEHYEKVNAEAIAAEKAAREAKKEQQAAEKLAREAKRQEEARLREIKKEQQAAEKLAREAKRQEEARIREAKKAEEQRMKEIRQAEREEAARLKQERDAAEKAAKTAKFMAMYEQARIKKEQKAAEQAARQEERERKAAEKAARSEAYKQKLEESRIRKEQEAAAKAARQAEKERLAAEKAARQAERERLTAEKAAEKAAKSEAYKQRMEESRIRKEQEAAAEEARRIEKERKLAAKQEKERFKAEKLQFSSLVSEKENQQPSN